MLSFIFWAETLLKAQMNSDLQTHDLKKKLNNNDSFWLIGQPDVKLNSGEWLVTSDGKVLCDYERIKVVSGIDRLAKINQLDREDLLLYSAVSENGNLWNLFSNATSGSIDRQQHCRGTGTSNDGRISPVFGDFQRFFVRVGDAVDRFTKSGVSLGQDIAKFVKRLRGDRQIAQWFTEISLHTPLTTLHYSQVTVLGFDYYDPKRGVVLSGGSGNIALWMLDTDYDGRSLYPSQVFFPMAGDKEGWSGLAKNLKAELDEESLEAFRGTVSLPFTPGKAIAVKIVDDRGIESLKIFR